MLQNKTPLQSKVGFIFVVVGGFILALDTFTSVLPVGSVGAGFALLIAGAAILAFGLPKKKPTTFKTDESKQNQPPK